MLVVSKSITAEDRKKIQDILHSSGFFYDFEIDIATGLIDDTLTYGTEACSYHWMKLYEEERLVAFANYVRNAFSVHSWDLYWLAVHQDSRNKKLGSFLLKEVENDVRCSGGKILWIDTSGRPLYRPTELFYRKNGYTLKASLTDFYAPGDPKHIYAKVLQ